MSPGRLDEPSLLRAEQRMNGIDYLDRGWRLNPQSACMIDGESGEQYSYTQVRDFTFRVGSALVARDYGIGSKVAVLSANHPLAFAVVLSVMRAGATYVPVNARNTIEENATIFSMFDCEVLFIQSAFAEHIAIITELAPTIRQIVCIDSDEYDAVSLNAWTDGFDSTPFDISHDGERPYEIVTTGGTTGLPKGVIWPNRLMENVVSNFMAVAPCDVPPVFLAAAPLTHLAGKFMQYVMCNGGTGIVMSRADKPLMLQLIPQYRVTHMFLPPTVIYDLLLEPNVRDVDYSSLRYFLYSAAPMAPEKVREAIEVFGPVMFQVWGQSEAGWSTALLPSDHSTDGHIATLDRLSSCGRPLPFVRVEVMADDGSILPVGEHGELVIRGQSVMKGYYNDPEATAAVSEYGWHHTGDIGFRDNEGYFYIVDRNKDMIISGGFNIYSIEVERTILDHPAVHECVVVGIPDEKWGESVTAVVQLKPNGAATERDIIDHCRARIGAMKSPKQVFFVEELPRNTNGKILKRMVRDEFWKGRTTQVS